MDWFFLSLFFVMIFVVVIYIVAEMKFLSSVSLAIDNDFLQAMRTEIHHAYSILSKIIFWSYFTIGRKCLNN